MAEPSVIYDFNPNSLPPELLKAVGLVTAAASQLDGILGNLLTGMLGLDVIDGTALTTHMAIPLKDQIIRTLADTNAPSVNAIDDLDEILDEVKAAFDLRNVVVHNAICMHPTTGEAMSMRMSARGSLQMTLQVISIEKMHEDAALIYEVGMRLMTFMISRGIGPSERTRPMMASVKRGQKARAERRNLAG